MINEILKQVGVLGAGGKMGSGIAMLLLQEMARLELETTEDVGNGDFRLVLIDSNDVALQSFSKVIKNHLIKYAERNINALRRYLISKEALISNSDIIQYFVDGALRIVRFSTEWQAAKNSLLIFEAIIEDISTKVEVFSQLAKTISSDAIFLTNTSSIPVHLLNENAKLDNRIIGFHFYNPPLIQKLVELIIPSSTHPRVVLIARALAKKLDKTIVASNDVAGFIGNGHFIREDLYACEQVEAIARNHSLPQAIYMINKVTQEFLIRPMGIFQLIDYIGIEVFYKICGIMSTYIPSELFQDPLIDTMVKAGIFGGQNAEGFQKNGFFQYEKHAKIGIYSPAEKKYLALSRQKWVSECESELGKTPSGHFSWKALQRDPNASEKLKNYFFEMAQDQTLGAELARRYLIKSKEIARKLVHTRVANSIEDVDTVLKNGFYHLYGLNEFELTIGLRGSW